MLALVLTVGLLLQQPRNLQVDPEILQEIGRLHMQIVLKDKQIQAMTEKIVEQQKEIEALKNPPKP